MDMKRMAFIVGLSSLLVACGDKDDSIVPPPAGMQTISLAGAQTRASLNTVSTTFGLYGTATATLNGTSTVFNNQRVDYDSGSNAWVYSPLKYWDSGADHKFAAYAPYDASRNLSFSAEGYPMVTNFRVQASVDNQESLLLSSVVGRNVQAGGLDTSPVVFTFDPALVRINFKIKRGEHVAGDLFLRTLRLYNLKSSGNCVQNGTRITWDTSSAPVNTSGYSTAFQSDREVSPEGINVWQNGALMIPQPVSGMAVYLSYTHRPGGVTYSYDKSNIALPGADWEPGKQITYVLTLNPENYVEFGEPIVEPWIDGSFGGGIIIVN